MVKSMKRKETKIEKLRLEIEIKNHLIQHLLKFIAKNKIELPAYIIDIIEMLYPQVKEVKK